MRSVMMPKRNSETTFAYAIASPALLIVAGVVLLPLATTLVYSLLNLQLTSVSRGHFVGLANYKDILSSREFWAALGRTAYFTVASTALETVLGLFIALLLNESFPGVRFLRSVVILPWAIPTIVNGSLWKWIYNGEYGIMNALFLKLGLIGEYRSWLSDPFAAMNLVVVADAWKMTPLAAIFFLAALQSVNRATYEAATVDGAGVLRRFFSLTLPYMTPTILVVLVMRTVEKFKAFDVFYMITRGGPANGTKVLMYETYLKAFTNLDYSGASTYGYLFVIIIASLTAVYIKALRKSEDMNA
jgi:multiple sugar transport system permease protein/N,N'-diacetylchitobiose transport system permease protein